MSDIPHDIHSSISSPVLRFWNSSFSLNFSDFVYPVFIKYDDDAFTEIDKMPNQYHIGCNKLVQYLKPLVTKGLKSVLLFGVCDPKLKDAVGSPATDENSPVIKGTKLLKKEIPELTIACDVCICGYTDHGHCGIIAEDGRIDNKKSLSRLTDIAKAYALAGADIIAPSDCMDGRINSIKLQLEECGLRGRVALMSYTAKFASSFYGPFRSAAQSTPSFGDRKCYQLPVSARGLALRAAKRDVEEGADILMVKPGLSYLDIIRDIKEAYPNYPMAVYHVSGEYAMLYAASQSGHIDLEKVALETMASFKRAGASIIITYLVPFLLELGEDRLNQVLF